MISGRFINCVKTFDVVIIVQYVTSDCCSEGHVKKPYLLKGESLFLLKSIRMQRIYNVSLVNVKETKQKMSEESDNTQVVKDFVSNLTVNIWSIKFYGYG